MSTKHRDENDDTHHTNLKQPEETKTMETKEQAEIEQNDTADETTETPAKKLKAGVDDIGHAAQLTAEEWLKCFDDPADSEPEEGAKEHQTALRKWRDDTLVMTRVKPFAKWFHKPSGGFVTQDDISAFLKDRPTVLMGEKYVPACEAVFKMSDRPIVDFIGYETSKASSENYTDGADTYYNSFPGLGVEECEGDTSYFDILLDRAVGREPLEAADGQMSRADKRKWIEQAFAFPIQNLGKQETKMPYALIFRSNDQGSGKSSLGWAVGAAYGGLKGHFRELDQKGLHADFTDDWSKALLVQADEVSLNDREDEDFLKNLISRRTVRINGKNQPVHWLSDHINWVITSNREDAIFLGSEEDRRYAIFDMDGKLGAELGKQVYDFTRDSKTGPAMLHRLRRVKMEGFNTSMDAPMTEARRRMFEANLSDKDAWAMNAKASPDEFLSPGKTAADLWSIVDLAGAFKSHHNVNEVSHKALSNSLRKANILLTQKVRTKAGLIKLYVFKNDGKWRDARTADIVEYYNKSIKVAKHAG